MKRQATFYHGSGACGRSSQGLSTPRARSFPRHTRFARAEEAGVASVPGYGRGRNRRISGRFEVFRIRAKVGGQSDMGAPALAVGHCTKLSRPVRTSRPLLSAVSVAQL